MIKVSELIAFSISVISLVFGYISLHKEKMPRYFQQYVCAVGCYMLEELWVIVNSLLGNGAENGLVTVRLFGFFGCLCFMLSANAHEFDKLVDEGTALRKKIPALLAPAELLALFAVYVIMPAEGKTVFRVMCAFICLSPALFASYFSLKHLLLPNDAMGYLEAIRGIDILALVFYTANFAYSIAYECFSNIIMGIYDIFLAVILLAIVIQCRKGARKWNTLI